METSMLAGIATTGADSETVTLVCESSRVTAGVMPDSVVSACGTLAGVSVLWISRYAAGGNLFLDLEVVEELTGDPGSALDHVIDRIPTAFRVDWAARLRRGARNEHELARRAAEVVHSSGGVPKDLPWERIDGPTRLPSTDDVTLLCAAPMGPDVVVLGRRGGPEFLDSELARLGHLLQLARHISRG